jgi:hypothetical protein
MTDGLEQESGGTILVRIWGMDAGGRAFFQNVRAQNLTAEDALLCGLDYELKINDVIGVQLEEKKARVRVRDVAEGGVPRKIQVMVQLLEGQSCPWQEAVPANAPKKAEPSGSNRRRFARHKLRYPVELRDERGGSAHMQTGATDISGRGCYIETLVPLPLGTIVGISFWIDSEKISTTGVVRASDPGVGMGIEFTRLDPLIQRRFQEFLQKMDPGFASSGGTP